MIFIQTFASVSLNIFSLGILQCSICIANCAINSCNIATGVCSSFATGFCYL